MLRVAARRIIPSVAGNPNAVARAGAPLATPIRSIGDTSQVSTEPLDTHIQRSEVPTFHFQASMPRLPIPKLEETLDKYLGVVTPIVPAAQLERTRKIVDHFREREGPVLQKRLVDRDNKNKSTSYISEWWFDKYLADRTPIVINSNPFLVLVDPEDPAMRTQLDRATRTIFSAARFVNSLRDEVLAPDVFHTDPAKSDTALFRRVARFVPRPVAWYFAYMLSAYPLDMSQYGSLFGTTRIPQRGMDAIRTDSTSRHVVVMRRGRFYSVEALREDGTPTPLPELRAALAEVIADTRPALPARGSLGAMTSQERDTWADVRAEVEASSEQNRAALDEIDRALFVVALDDAAHDDPLASARQFLHSDGLNRWADKSFSVLIAGNGVTSINFEHAWGDGVAVLRFITDVYQDSVRQIPAEAGLDGEVPSSFTAAREIELDLPAKVGDACEEAASRLAAHSGQLQIELRRYEGFGKAHLKTCKVSPDGIAQLSLQLAYARMFGRTVSTYESASTAGFRKGRTETVRPATIQTKAFCDAFLEGNRSKEELMALLRAATDRHNKWTVDGATGKGVDRHLFGLSKMAEADSEMDIPEIFTDPSFATMKHDHMSTSTLGVEILQGGGFGPTVKDGFGIGYNVAEHDIGFVVSSNGGEQDVVKFVDAIEASLNDIGEIISP